MQVKIFCANGFYGDVMRSCLKDDVEFKGFIHFQSFISNPDTITESEKESLYFIVQAVLYKDILIKHGIDADRIFVFKGRAALSYVFKNLKLLKFWRWLFEFMKESLCGRLSENISNKFPFLRPLFEFPFLRRDIRQEANFMKLYHDNKQLVFFGFNEITKVYINELERVSPSSIYGIVLYPSKTEVDQRYQKYVKDIDEIIYDQDRLYFYIVNGYEMRKIESFMIDNNISLDSVRSVYRPQAKALIAETLINDAYDPIIGFTRSNGKYPGFTVFEDDQSNDDSFKIITLGGSTTDPYLSNMFSWSEYLYNILKDMGISVKIYVGGIAAYTVGQETLKLVKDCVTIKPDLILSYSGVNNIPSNIIALDNYQFTRKEIPAMFNKIIKRREITEGHIVMTKLTLGIEDPEPRSKNWLRCERTMHAVCNEFGIKFHAFLQPAKIKGLIVADSQESVKMTEEYYADLTKYIAQGGGWLHDFTHIFDGHEEVFYDYCHVYEKGNRIIAQKILPFVLEAIADKNKNKREN